MPHTGIRFRPSDLATRRPYESTEALDDAPGPTAGECLGLVGKDFNISIGQNLDVLYNMWFPMI